MNVNRLLVLGASRYYSATISHLKSCNYEVFALDRQENSPGFAVADHSAAIDFSDSEKVIAYARQHNINAIMPLNDYGVQTAAKVNNALGLCGLQSSTASYVAKKSLMRIKWQAAGLFNPKFITAKNLQEAQFRLGEEKLSYPLIIKPDDSRGGGSRGVEVIENDNDFPHIFAYAQSFYDDPTVIIEECLQGSEHSVEVLVNYSKIILLGFSLKQKTPLPYRVDKQVIYPACFTDEQKIQITETIDLAMKAIDFTNGVAHVEFAFTKHGPVLFEIGLRPGGGATPLIINKVYGINYLDLYAKTILGQHLNFKVDKKIFNAVIYHFFILKPGLTCVKNSIDFKMLPFFENIDDIEIFNRIGEKTTSVKTGPERHGFAVIKAQNIIEAQKIACALDQHIEEHYYAAENCYPLKTC